MRKLLLAFIFLGCALLAAQTQPPGINLGTYPVAQAITNISSQMKWSLAPLGFNPSGMLYVNYGGAVTGSPAGCSVAIAFASTNVVNVTAAGGTFVFTTAGQAITPGVTPFGAHFNTSGTPLLGFTSLSPQYTCTTYPTSGQMTFEFVPDPVPVYNYTHITTNGSFLLKPSCGLTTCVGTIHNIVINQPGSGETITVLDSQNSLCSPSAGTIAILTGTFTVGQVIEYDATTISGLCIQTSGTTAGDYTVIWR